MTTTQPTPTSTLGTLLSPQVRMSWGDVSLMPFVRDDGQLEHLAHSLSINLNKDETLPKLTFDILANPLGFATFQKLKAEALDKPINVKFSYPNGNSIAWTFKFSGMAMSTGLEPALRITAVSIVKGCWTSNRLSFSMENAVSLENFPQFVQSQAGECAKDIQFQFVGTAAEAAKKVMVKSNFNQQTPHNILTAILRRAGMSAQVGDSAMGGGLITISSAPAYNGELAADLPKLITGDEPATPGLRSLWVMGPSAFKSIDRQQDFSTGRQTSRLGANNTRPISEDTNAPNVVQPGSSPQDNAANQQQPVGVRGPSNPGPEATGTVVPDPEAAKKRAALAGMLQTKVSMEVLYLPLFAAGIRPRDIVAIPSLKSGEDRFVEDFEVTNVLYTLAKNGGITMAITGERPFTGEANMLDGQSVKEVRAVADQLTTLEDWASYLWLGNGSVGSAPSLAR